LFPSLSAGSLPRFIATCPDEPGLTVCNLLAPERVIVIGAMAEAGELVLGPMRTALRRHIAPDNPPELVLGTLGSRNTALGAIAMALTDSGLVPPAERPV
jgi:hypothetical protein